MIDFSVPCVFAMILNFDHQLHSGSLAVAVTNNGGGGFETKAAVNQVFSRRPCPEIGRKRVLALIERSRGRGLSMEIGWWGVGGWMEMGGNISTGGIWSA